MLIENKDPIIGFSKIHPIQNEYYLLLLSIIHQAFDKYHVVVNPYVILFSISHRTKDL